MADEVRRGFNVDGKFFPVVYLDDWGHDDFLIARRLTDLGPVALGRVDADDVFVTTAFAAVAFRHGNMEIPLEKIRDYFGALKPSEIEAVGLGSELEPETPKGEAADTPPSEIPSPNSSSSTEPSTDASPEKPAPIDSGDPGSDTGSPASHLG